MDFFLLFPHITVGFLFSCLHPAGRRPPSSAVVRRRALSHTHHKTYLIIHKSCHIIHNSSHITHHSSHTQLISHNTHLTHTHITKLISYNLIHNSSHTPHLIHHITHHSSHTHTHTSPNLSYTHLISYITSHTTHLTHTHHKTYLIIHKSSHIIHNSSHTQLILHTTHLTDSAWQAQYAELPEEGVARIVAAVAAARCCVAGAVHRAS